MALDVRQLGLPAYLQFTAGLDLDGRMLLADLVQADQPRRSQHTGLHHQHHRRAARDGPDARIFRVEQ